jgi:hypothetical protein
MCRKGSGFHAQRFLRQTEGQLVVAFFVLLYGVGGGAIWYYYGRYAALLGWICMTGGLLLFLLLYALVWLIGRWAGE